MITIDKLCYTSRLRYENAGEKFAFAMLTLLMCVISRSMVVAGIVLVVTGILSVLLGVKEYLDIKGPLWQESFLKILRRTMLFLNLMLSAVVAGTLISMLA